jgi:hypothetical protein
MSRRQRFLGTIADPQIAYLLLTLGTLGLTIELWSPGAIVPGVAGGLCLLLAFFAFQILPVNVTGLLLILFGLGLVILELKVPSFGALGIGGAISLLVGSIMVTREVPGVRVGLNIILPVVLILSAACCCSVVSPWRPAPAARYGGRRAHRAAGARTNRVHAGRARDGRCPRRTVAGEERGFDRCRWNCPDHGRERAYAHGRTGHRGHQQRRYAWKA